ncbi:hypothetical protein RDI58_000409 [Solanum bulbocastanum]|uniref:Uncharacterized protein n=1 Tax=Solanum bulbocastanum TaxID=147425 RepID=A0AAN8U1C4_SOLBU
MMGIWAALRIHLVNHMKWSVVEHKTQMQWSFYLLSLSQKLYPEPSELKQNSINLKQMMAQRSSGTTLTNSSRRFATPSQSTRTRSIMRRGSSSKSTMRKHGDGHPAKSNDQSVQDSGKSGRSALTSSGSFDHSQDQKSKKKRKTDG